MTEETGIGDTIRLRRKGAGLSLRGLSIALHEEGLDLDTSALSRVESGQRDLRFSEALIIASRLGFSLDQFLTGDTSEQPVQQARDAWIADVEQLIAKWSSQ